MDRKRRVIDKRKKEKFMLDDEYLNGQAKLCGWQATLVYLSLCRHANKNQESFPSIKLMAEEHGVGRNTIIKGLKALETRKVIVIEKARKKDGKWLNNSYILLDKSEWDYTKKEVIQVPVEDSVKQPCPSQNIAVSLSEQNQVPVEDTKETHRRKHIEGNTSLSSPKGKELSFVSLVEKYFIKKYEEKFGSPPAINFGQDGKRVKSCAGLFQGEEWQKLIDDFLNSDKGGDMGYTLSICFSAHTINLWKSKQLVYQPVKITGKRL